MAAFYVEFGFNETELTSLLEDSCYYEAINLILESAHTSYLDEGCYQRTPLFIVLCGKNRSNSSGFARNFKIAKLLVQHGASPNFRVPETDFGIYLKPGKSGLELLIEFFLSIISNERYAWDSTASPVIGMNGNTLNDFSTLCDEILELVFIFLSHGADCNILNENHQTLLHRVILNNSSTPMTKLLCDSGADLNVQDDFGNTPLIYACMSSCVIDEAHSNYEFEEKKSLLQILLTYPNIEVNACNKLGQSALFHCMREGKWSLALILLDFGCSVSEKGLYNVSLSRNDELGTLSSLLVSCMSTHSRKTFINFVTDKNEIENSLIPLPLIETGKFNVRGVLEEVHTFAKTLQIDISKMKQLRYLLLTNLFGTKSLSLKQRCTRQVCKSWIMSSWPDFTFNMYREDMLDMGVEHLQIDSNEMNEGIYLLGKHKITENEEASSATIKLPIIIEESDESINHLSEVSNLPSQPKYTIPNTPNKIDSVSFVTYLRKITDCDIEKLVVSLSLPRDTTVCFESELLRLLIMAYLYGMSESDFKMLMCDGSPSNYSDYSSENESDLEYW